jgi:hypothetical protein
MPNAKTITGIIRFNEMCQKISVDSPQQKISTNMEFHKKNRRDSLVTSLERRDQIIKK